MLNFVCIQGRLTKDAELRFTKTTEKAVASFTLACDRGGKDGGADFINCVAWEKTAQFIDQYFKKGDMCLVTGKLTQRNYEDSNGNKRTAYEVLVRDVNFCGSKNSTNEKPRYQEPVMAEIDDSDGELPF